MSNTINLERYMDKLESKDGFLGMKSETISGVAYAKKRNQLVIVTASCGQLNIAIDRWDALKAEVDEIINDMRGI